MWLWDAEACVCMLSCSVMSLSFANLQSVACQAPLSMAFPRQEYWGGWPIFFFRGSSKPRDKNCVFYVSYIAGDSLPLNHQGSPLRPMQVSESSGRLVVSNSLWPQGLEPAKLLCPWNSPGKNTGVGCQALLHGIFPTQGLNPGLLCYRQILYHFSYPRSPLRPIGEKHSDF